MNYLMQRSQIFIRKTTDTPFHVEIDNTWIDRVKDTTKEFSNNCEVVHGYVNDYIFRITYHLSDIVDYIKMSDCLYDKGELKEVFKEAMKHTKTNNIAFAMPSWWTNKTNKNGMYIKEWYYNKKLDSKSKFLEELKETLPDRMYALKNYMSLNDCIMNCAIYDYDHTTKHSYFLYTKRDYETEKEIDNIRKNASKNFQYKKDHNKENNIDYFIGRNNTNTFEFHDFNHIPKGVFDDDFTKLNIPILYK